MIGGNYQGAGWPRRAGREGWLLCVRKGLGHFRMGFILFRREQVWPLPLRKMACFLRPRSDCGRDGWQSVLGLGGRLSPTGTQPGKELPLLSFGGGSCEGWDPHREGMPLPPPGALQLHYLFSWAQAGGRHSIALPGLQVNVLALSICTREAYQSMKERNVDDGHIININR